MISTADMQAALRFCTVYTTMADMPPKLRFYTVPEVGEILRLGATHVYHLILDGYLECVAVQADGNKKMLVSQAALEEFVAARLVEADA